MERHIDYLSFQAGGKMTVPFEAFLIFSTNLRPDQLGDEAFLRRIQYKMFLRNPRAAGIHSDLRALRGLEATGVRTGAGGSFVEKHYVQGGKRFRRCHPRDVISHAIDIIHFESLPMALNEDVLDRAFQSCFAENVDVTE